MTTKIEWVVNSDGTMGETWNPVVGCTRIAKGCVNCYAKTLHDKRHKAYLQGAQLPAQYAEPFEKVQLMPERLERPLHWKKPRTIFVNSVSDLFHKDVPFDFVDRVMAVCALAPRHTFIILTKRPERMREYFTEINQSDNYAEAISRMTNWQDTGWMVTDAVWPLPNVWLGTSVSTQADADKNIPYLLQTPAAVRWVSYEPALEAVDFSKWLTCWTCGGTGDMGYGDCAVCGGSGYVKGLDWLVCGCESGSSARTFDEAWARSAKEQCQAAGVAYFYKQGRDSAGRVVKTPMLDGEEWRQFPAGSRGARSGE